MTSLFLYIVIQVRKMGSQEFTEIIHISTYYVYKRLFSSQVKMFVLPIMPQCTWISYLPCEYFSFLPSSMRLFLLMYQLGHSTAVFSGGFTFGKMFYMPLQICKKQNKTKKSQCLYYKGELEYCGSVIHFEECKKKKTHTHTVVE